ncbi:MULTISPECIES: DcaP family trimeric outer membrane transporter [unclassified Janthinobacterium]|uniref:DcaP family trimeric outer membrane transporter n=1 Tax=unclassified Janthinobacterium TaxID=2610881 RepID=UPI0003448AA3|nr:MULTISPECIES: DcaP family trimeric outer membrane transporter [unclassified Janthinobacterium]MEC5162450.1 hypothetical protein [Janthinobacterium sp. CG_S6]
MNLKHTSLSASIALMFAVVAAPSQAQSAKDFADMRAEIKRLGDELKELKQAKAAAPAAAPAPAPAISNAELAERVEQVELRVKDAVVGGDIPNSSRLPGSDTSVRLYGFAELNMVKEFKGDNANNDYSTFAPYAPLNDSAEGRRKGGNYLHARTSRFGIEASTPTQYGPLSVKIEGDFNNDPRTGNAAVYGDIKNIYTQQATNSYNFRLRHAYGQFGGLLVGQTWSTFMDVDNSPETVDFNGTIGGTFIRQPMVRYTYPTKDYGSFTVAAENASSYVLEDGAATPKGFAKVPDVVARWDKGFGWGAVSVRAVTTEHRLDDGADVNLSKRGYGFAASSLYKTFGSDFLTVGVTGGSGIGRYFNYIEGALYDAANKRILTEKALGLVLGYQHKPSDTLRFNGSVGYQRNYDNAYTDYARANGLDSGQYAVNSKVWQAHLGFIWNPVKGVDFGAEYILGRRKTLAGEEGDLSRVNLSAKYNFN